MTIATFDQVKSFGKHVVSYAMGGISVLMVVHILSPAQGGDATSAIDQITTGVKSIVAGITTLVSIAMGVWAALQQSPLAQLINGSTAITQGTIDPKTVPIATQKAMVAATDKLPTVVNVVAQPEVANSITSDTVVSSADTKVVKK